MALIEDTVSMRLPPSRDASGRAQPCCTDLTREQVPVLQNLADALAADLAEAFVIRLDRLPYM